MHFCKCIFHRELCAQLQQFYIYFTATFMFVANFALWYLCYSSSSENLILFALALFLSGIDELTTQSLFQNEGWSSVPTFSPWWWRQQTPSKRCWTYIRLHSAINQKKAVFNACCCENLMSQNDLHFRSINFNITEETQRDIPSL
jgi:hypothetical protein